MGAHAVCNRLRHVSAHMQYWGQVEFGSIRKRIKELKVQLHDAKQRPLGTGFLEEIRDIEGELKDIFEKEEIMFKQRSRVSWLKEGDQNTKYFQNCASHRKRKNTVRGLLRPDGTKCQSDEGMREMAKGFYQNLFASEGAHIYNGVLELIHSMVSDEMNHALTKPFSEEEIETALFQMGLTKSPGRMGYQPSSISSTGSW